MADEEIAREHVVLVNDEEQYSLWLADRAIPRGWRSVWGPATKQACLAHIDAVWTDMRPLSLRKQMHRQS